MPFERVGFFQRAEVGIDGFAHFAALRANRFHRHTPGSVRSRTLKFWLAGSPPRLKGPKADPR